jgi:hypothetical protein
MNDNHSNTIEDEMGSDPLACFPIEVEEELYERFRIYVNGNDVNERLLTKRLLNNALREFLDNYAPIVYPISPLEV